MWPFKKPKKGWIGIISIVSEQGYCDIIELEADDYEAISSRVLMYMGHEVRDSNIVSCDSDINTEDPCDCIDVYDAGRKKFDEYVPNSNIGIVSPNYTYIFKVVVEDEHKYKTTYTAKLFNLDKKSI